MDPSMSPYKYKVSPAKMVCKIVSKQSNNSGNPAISHNDAIQNPRTNVDSQIKQR